MAEPSPYPGNRGAKLSNSLVNNPLGVNKPVPFGPRKEPWLRLFFGISPATSDLSEREGLRNVVLPHTIRDGWKTLERNRKK